MCHCKSFEWVGRVRIVCFLLITGTISIAASQKLFCVCIIVLYIIYPSFGIKIAAIVRVCEFKIICVCCCITLDTMNLWLVA